MDYQELTQEHLDALRRERIQSLEGEHARRAIMLEEALATPGEEGIAASLEQEMANLEQRITHHRGQIGEPEPEPERDDDAPPARVAPLSTANGSRQRGSRATRSRTGRPSAK